MDEGIAESIKCIEPNCDIIVDDENVMKLVQEAEVRQKYNRIMVNSFIEVLLFDENFNFATQ